jgi:hypothetical protein
MFSIAQIYENNPVQNLVMSKQQQFDGKSVFAMDV